MTIDPGITVGTMCGSLGAVSPPTAATQSQGVQNTHTLKTQSRESRPWICRVAAAAWGERFWFQSNKGRLHFTFVSPDYKFPVRTSEGSKNCSATRRSQDESRHEGSHCSQ